MAKDIRYQILIDGEPDEALTAEATEIEVTQTIDGPTTFRVRFATDVCEGDVAFVDDDRLKPGQPDTLVSVLVVVNTTTFCIAHGVITRRRGSFMEGGPGSWLEIFGNDRRAVMDRVQRVTHYQGKASEAVQQILDSYQFDTDVEQTTVEYEEDDHTLAQHDTDFEFVNMLAGQNDFYFWIDFEVDGTSVTETAHFKPSPPREQDAPLFSPPRLLAPPDSVTIKLNSADGCSNVLSFEFESDAEVPNQSGDIRRIDFDSAEEVDTTVPAPTTEVLGDQQNPAQERSRRLVTAGSVEEGRIVNQAALNDASWSVTARTEATVHALGGIVSAHDVISVTGAGKVADGDYFVRSVTHNINPADHRLSMELLRNALGG